MTATVSAFLAVATLLIIAPGPDSLLVARNTVRRGRAGGLITAAGTLTGLSLWAGAAALGLSSLVRASQLGYDALRVAGGGYLVWLGVESLRARRDTFAPACEEPTPAEPGGSSASSTARVGWARMYAMGSLSNILNPKIGVFFVAFLPSFIPADAPVGATSGLLGLLFVGETGLWLALLSSLVLRGAGWLRRPRIQKVIERVTGVVLIGFGIRLATEAR